MESRMVLNGSAWTAIGPAPIVDELGPGQGASGRISGIAADPTDANTIYIAAAGGGVWKTTDGGTNWTPLTDGQETTAMGAIAIAPSNHNVLYAGTGEANNSGDSQYGRGILHSTDGGATWTLETAGGAFNRKSVSKIVVDPADPNTAYAAIHYGNTYGNTGIWKTTDGGASWTNTTTAITPSEAYSDIVMDPTNSQVLYAAVGSSGGSAKNGVYETTNGGTSWSELTNFPSGSSDGRIALAISKTNHLELFGSISTPGGSLLAMMKSTDGGATWAQESSTPNYLGAQGWYDTTLAIDPSNANRIYAAGTDNSGPIGVIESTDGGATWTAISQGVDNKGPHTDDHAAVFDANGKLLTGNDGGIWRLDDPNVSTLHWTDLNGDLNTIQFTGIALHPTNPSIAYGGSQDNGTSKTTGSTGWNSIRGGDGGFVRVDPTNPQTIYHTYNYGSGTLERSDDGGSTWVNASTGINFSNNGDFYPPYVIDPSNSSRLIFGNTQVYETLNKGGQWNPISTPGANGWTVTSSVDAIAVAPNAPNTIYVTAGGHVLVTVNDGATWKQVDIPGIQDYLPDVEVDPTNSQVAYVVRDSFDYGNAVGKVFKTTNGGTTWTNISGNLADVPGRSFAIDPRNGALYLGTDEGVEQSVDGGTTWSAFGTGLPHAQVVGLEINTTTGILGAGTHGRGLWETPIGGDHFQVVPSVTTTSAGTVFGVDVTVLDNNNYPVTNYLGTIHFTSSDGSATLPANYTFTAADAGHHDFANSVTLVTAGNQTVAVNDAANQISGFASVAVTAGALDHLGLTGPSSSVAGNRLTYTVSALDHYNNVITAYAGTVHFSSTDPIGVSPADYTFTVVDAGVHAFTNGVTLKTAGNQVVTVTDAAMSSIHATQAVAVSPAAVSKLVVSGLPNPSTAGVAGTFTVKAEDAYNNIVTGFLDTVRFTSTDAKAILPAAYTFTAADAGVHLFTPGVTYKTAANAQTLTALDSQHGTIKGTQTVAVVAAAATVFVTSGYPNPTVAGASHTFSLTAKDAYGNVATGYVGTVHFTSTDTQAVLPADYTFLAANKGVHSFNATLKTAGGRTITATDTVTSTLTGKVSTTVNPAAASRTIVSAFPNPDVAGAAHGVTVRIEDAYGNTVTSYLGTVHFTSTDAQAILPANYTFTATDKGVHTFSNGVTLKTAGTESIIATDTAKGTITGKQIVTVNPAAMNHLLVTAPGSVVSGHAFNVTVTAEDAFNNVVVGYLGTVKLTSSDGSATLPPNYTFTATDKGVHVLTGVVLRTVGNQSVTATDTHNASFTGTVTIGVTASLPARLASRRALPTLS